MLVCKGGVFCCGYFDLYFIGDIQVIDSGNCGVRMFFVDYLKGFDLIDYFIFFSFLIEILLINWIRVFFIERL